MLTEMRTPQLASVFAFTAVSALAALTGCSNTPEPAAPTPGQWGPPQQGQAAPGAPQQQGYQAGPMQPGQAPAPQQGMGPAPQPQAPAPQPAPAAPGFSFPGLPIPQGFPSALPMPTMGPNGFPAIPLPGFSSPQPPAPPPAPAAPGASPFPFPSPFPAQSPVMGGSDTSQRCVDTINRYRASKQLAPLARWSDGEACTVGESAEDARTQRPHGSFGRCREMGQNACPNWPGPADQMHDRCLQDMWNEGPGEFPAHGHYMNMASPKFTQVACGVHQMADGKLWAIQNFR